MGWSGGDLKVHPSRRKITIVWTQICGGGEQDMLLSKQLAIGLGEGVEKRRLSHLAHGQRTAVSPPLMLLATFAHSPSARANGERDGGREEGRRQKKQPWTFYQILKNSPDTNFNTGKEDMSEKNQTYGNPNTGEKMGQSSINI